MNKNPNRKVEASNGRTMYYLDNRLASQEDYEAWEANREDETEPESGCIFCGKSAHRTKFVDLKLVKLCEEDYQIKTTGEIAAIVRREAHA